MKARLKIVLGLLLVGGACAAAYQPVAEYWKQRNQPTWKQVETNKGTIIAVVNSTGTVKPVLSVQIGSFVSGPIKDLFVDFNQEVEKDELLATIDARIYEATVARDRAFLATSRAEVDRAQSLLQQAINNEERALSLQEENEDFISDQELDQLKFNRLSLEASLKVAQASIDQAQANLDNSLANLGYTEIRSPVAGMIIDRKIDPGQTLAAQFQTPELFVVAPNMREEMHIYASVDEADIGLIRSAQEDGRPVHFTVDAYRDDLFKGAIAEIRFSSTELQNVVTYPVIVAASNPDLKLLPGMTASISFRVDERENTIRVPNAALRFYPDIKYVREQDKKLLEGKDWDREANAEEDEAAMSATEKAEVRKKRNRRHVWVVEGDFLRAIEVETGLSDSKYSELVSGDLKEGQKLVTGVEPKKGFGS
ncbi:MAG: efflux RND transporter periplasmic adaptor subunit [Planctomycetaceae bacterium]|nr:efflux RND transporter periplasmic adaptor subunit [Planctomycetales bacterium]MCB9927306.1 efflux RND transporter periplasmic adaptor subunit [Planctomycetaceae bacterium]